jgi:hypothetical protein
LRALVAKTLGEGEHHIDIALSASHLWIDEFRENRKSIYLNSDHDAILRETLKLIRFKTSVNSRAWKECRVEILGRPFAFHELAAVSAVIPKTKYRNYVLWQLGHGDLQQVVFVDGTPMPETLQRTEGVSFAVKKLGELLNLPNQALADIAWRNENFSAFGEINGKTNECLTEKKKAIRSYFSQQVIGKFINVIQPYKQKSPNVILSGGGAKDKVLVDVLREEVENLGYKFWPIDKIPSIETLGKSQQDLLSDPLYTCVEGLCTKASLGIDVGNSTLKSKWGNKNDE